MAKTRSTRRAKPKDANRRSKKKISPLLTDNVDFVDYKDVDLLRRFMSDRAKLKARRVSGNDSQQQRVVARAVKNAREMGLLPYATKVTTQRRSRSDRSDRGDRGDRRPREDRSDGPRSEASPGEAEAVVEVVEAPVEAVETVTSEGES